MAPKTAADFLNKAKKLRIVKKKDFEEPSDGDFIKGRDNNDADEYDMRKLTRNTSPP